MRLPIRERMKEDRLGRLAIPAGSQKVDAAQKFITWATSKDYIQLVAKTNGWANVPTLNLLMGLPVKMAAGMSGLILGLVDSSAAWVYINHGAVLPMLAVPGWCDSQRLPKAVAVVPALYSTAWVRLDCSSLVLPWRHAIT